MGNTEFRYKRPGQYLGLIFLIPFITLLLSQYFPLVDIRGLADRISVGDYPSIWGVLGFLVSASLVLLEIWLFVSMVVFGITYKITTTNTTLIITGWDFWGRKLLIQMNHGYYLGTIPYESIASVDLDSWKPGVIKLVFRDESYIFLPVRALENQSEFIDQLSEKLVNTKGVDALAIMKQPKRFKFLQTFIYSLAFIPTIFLLLFMLVHNFEPRIWKEELSPWYVRSVSADSDGTIWVTTSDSQEGKIIWRLSENNREHWPLSEDVCVCSAFSVSHDPLGFPRVFDDQESFTTIYAWNGSEWNQQTVEADFFNMKLHSMDTRVWGEQNGKLAYMDFMTNQLVVVPLPSEAVSEELELSRVKVSQNGSVFATFSAEGKVARLFRFDGRVWSKPYPAAPEGLGFHDFYEDTKGNVWAFSGDLDLSELNFSNPMLGYYNSENAEWVWKDITPIRSHDGSLYISDFVVDRFERIWLSGTYRTSGENGRHINFVTVLDWTESGLIPLVEYNPQNSNIDFAGQFLLTSNRIWIWDRELLWQDIHTEKLLSPLPDWMAWMKEFYDDHFGWYFIALIGLIILSLIGLSLEYR